MKKKIAIIGSTGSIGQTTLSIIKNDLKKFKIELLSSNKNYKLLLKQAKLFNVKNIIIHNENTFKNKKNFFLKEKINAFNSLNEFKKKSKKTFDYTMCSISGIDGLKPTLEIIDRTKEIAIANKESIICAWNLIFNKLRKHNTKVIPIDSEHFSIWSLIQNNKLERIDRVYITASGGPFLKLPLKQFSHIDPDRALNHPNWNMGKKISIDSATMINKVFEIIEAKNLFNLDYNQVKAIIHPDSYVHAIVKFDNGLIKLLIHDTSMTIPIYNSLYLKDQKKIFSKPIDFKKLNNLNFKEINSKRYPAINILKYIPNSISLFETVLVSTNDELVSLFLKKKIKFNEISKKLISVLNLKEFIKYKKIKPKNINEILNLNKYVRLKTRSLSV